MGLQTKTIGRMPTDHGPYDPNLAYGKKFCTTIFGCMWESLHDNNNTAPAVWDGGDTITPNLVDWKKVSGDYNAWLMNQDKPAQSVDYPFNGMGRVKLQKHIVDGHNLLYQDDFYKGEVGSRVSNTNTVFEVPYEFELAADITIPANCVLEFNGGSISGNHTLTGTNTHLHWNGTVIFGSNVTIAGTWLCPVISTKMFSDLSANNALNKVENLNNDNIQTTVFIERESYNYKYNPTTGGDRLLNLKSNTEYKLNGVIETVFDPSINNHRVLNIQTKKNIIIYGSGELVGNRGSATGQTGDGVEVYDSENITIDGLKIYGFRADGVYIGCNNEGNNKNIYIKNCNIYNNGRQGITVVAGTNIYILSCFIHDIDTNGDPGYSIDIEPNDRYQGDYVENVYILNNVIDNHLGVYISKYPNSPIPKNIYIKNNKIINFRKYAINALVADGVVLIEGNYIKGYPYIETEDPRNLFPKWSDAQIYLRGNYVKQSYRIINNYIEASVVTFDSIFSNNTVDTIFLSFSNTMCCNNDISVRYIGISSAPIMAGADTIMDGNKIMVKDSLTEVGEFSNVISLASNDIISNNKIGVDENITTINGLIYCSLDSGGITPRLINNDYPSDIPVAPFPDGYGTHEEINYLGAPHLGTTKPQFIVPEPGRCLNHVGFEFFDTSNNKKSIWNGTIWVDLN